MNRYKIVGRTNGWIAARDIHFKGHTEITIEKGMTLKEACKKLLGLFCEDYGIYCKHWGIARRLYPSYTRTFKDGTRSYEYDSRTYSIEKEL